MDGSPVSLPQRTHCQSLPLLIAGNPFDAYSVLDGFLQNRQPNIETPANGLTKIQTKVTRDRLSFGELLLSDAEGNSAKTRCS